MVNTVSTIAMDNTSTWIIGILVFLCLCCIICCCLSSLQGIMSPSSSTIILSPTVPTPTIISTPPVVTPIVTPPVVNPQPPVTPYPGNGVPGATGTIGTTTTQIPKIRFCSQPNLGGTCKTYDLTYKFYPIDAACGSDPIGFKPQSAVIEGDDSTKYKLNVRGSYGNPGDNTCGPSQLPLNGSANCYTTNIYGVSGDRGSCINDTAAGVNWISTYVNGGINVER